MNTKVRQFMPWARELSFRVHKLFLKKLRSLCSFKMTGEPLDIVHGKKKKKKKKKEYVGCSASELLLIAKSSRLVLQDFYS